MKLSQLKNGEKAIISKINGNGPFRKRILEMGLIEGKEIRAIKKAPLLDPAEYSIMGYNLTLRKSEAELIEISDIALNPAESLSAELMEESVFEPVNKVKKTIRIALVGNPNCGKTTLFNFASNSHERVANYTGVTVSAKEASAVIGEQKISIVDLPGTYSLSSYSPEELYVIDFLTTQKPDVVVNVIDGSNLERNLFLTTQLIDMDLNMVIALNMFDEMESNSDIFNYKQLSEMIGIPIIPTVGTKGKGVDALFKSIVDNYYTQNTQKRKITLKYPCEIEGAIKSLETQLNNFPADKIKLQAPSRFLAFKLLEGDKFIAEKLAENISLENIVTEINKASENIETLYQKDPSALIADSRYGFISGALTETYKQGTRKSQEISRKADKIITGKLLGIPLFFALIWATFYATFKLGEFPVGIIENLLGLLSGGADKIIPAGMIHDLVIDGIIGGVGGVIVFLPSIMILFLFISLMEDTGYMARTAFLMDKAMHKMGLHGKSFIPMLMGFGCNVPAVMATRTIESKRDRILTMLAIPFMSCSARLPVYVLFISAFFPFHRSSILFSIYLIGIFAAFVTALIFNKTVFKKVDSPFVMELPPYRFPTFKAVMKHMWFKSYFFLKKMGTIILTASIIIWALGYFPRNKSQEKQFDAQIEQTKISYNQKIDAAPNTEAKNLLITEKQEKISQIAISKNATHLEQSFISSLGKGIEPIFKPLGFDWKMSVSILTGVLAKEIVVSSMGVLYHADNAADETSVSLISKLQENQKKSQTPRYVYLGFLLFILLYFPCIGTLAAIRKETGNVKWMLFETFYTTSIAWFVAWMVFTVGNLI